MKLMKIAPQKIKSVNINDIKPNPYQSRRNFNIFKLNSLAASIKEFGILSPVILRSIPTGYEIIAGNRRLRAAKIAGLNSVPAIIIRAKDRECALLSISENINRENLSMFEEAEGLYNLLSYHKMKKEALLNYIGGDREELNAKLRLLSLTPAARYKIEKYSLSNDIIKELLKIHDRENQEKAITAAAEEHLTAEEVSFLAKKMNTENRESKKKIRLANIPICTNTIKKTVNILKENGERAEFSQKEDEKYIEYTIKVRKQSVF